MFKFNLLLAVRHLKRNKTYSILNVLGLTIGLACAILLFLSVIYNLSYDKFNKNYSRLYNLNSWIPVEGTKKSFANTQHSALLGPLLIEHIPEIENFTRIVNSQYIIKHDNKTFIENGIFADTNFFKLFSSQLKEGNYKHILEDNNSIVISERLAKIFFDNSNCIGKTIVLKNENSMCNFQIEGVMKDAPDQSSLKFDYIIPFSRFLTDHIEANELTAWSNTTWLLLKPNVNIHLINSKINDLINKESKIKDIRYFLFPLKDKHLYNYVNGQKSIFGNILDVILFSVIAVSILLIACFNFMNLGIALTTKRYTATGIKKILGSSRTNIITQFLSESLILSLLSLGFALIIVSVVLPFFNSFSASKVELAIPFSNPKIMLAFGGMAIFAGLLSGIYPAIVNSSVSTSNILKSNILLDGRLSNFRQGLIIFQFIVSFIFITFTIVIWEQAEYINAKDLGLIKENILVFENHNNILKHQTLFKSELLSLNEVSSLCYSNSMPFTMIRNYATVDWPGKEATIDNIFPLINTDYDFLETLGPKLLRGRFFDKELTTDRKNFVINETAAKIMALDNPVGKIITVNGHKGTIIGLVKDFQTSSLFTPYLPVVIKMDPNETCYTVIKFLPGKYKQLVENLERIFKKFESDYPLEAHLVSETYQNENLNNKATWLTGIFAFIAITLACLGLFGLASFTVEKRTKEIGVRKINGASNYGILKLLIQSYIKWLILAILIGMPIAYLLSATFLRIFAFHVHIPLMVFVFVPLLLICVALLSVSMQSFRAATRNPVESLRYE